MSFDFRFEPPTLTDFEDDYVDYECDNDCDNCCFDCDTEGIE